MPPAPRRSRLFRIREVPSGVSGTYVARVVDPVSGEVVGRWGSIPIRGGGEVTLFLPVGDRALRGVQNLTFFLTNSPNPFSPQIQITYVLPEPSDVRLMIYNTLGQEVRLLGTGYWEAGAHQVSWDGRDERDRAVSSGFYFTRLASEGLILTRRMVLLK